MQIATDNNNNNNATDTGENPAANLSDADKAALEASKSVSINGAPPENTPPADAPSGDRPQWLPEKFKSAEDMARAYQELEKKLSAPSKQEPTPPAKADDKAAPADAPNGVDFGALAAEYETNGTLSEDSYKAMEAAGIPKNIVDTYVQGIQAMQYQRQQEGYKLVGGEEGYSKMTAWAKANMSPAEIEAFNNGVSGTLEQMQFAIKGLHARYESAVGKTPALLNGSASSNTSSGGFASQAEIIAAMSDVRYEKDSAYRKQVEARVAATSRSVI